MTYFFHVFLGHHLYLYQSCANHVNLFPAINEFFRRSINPPMNHVNKPRNAPISPRESNYSNHQSSYQNNNYNSNNNLMQNSNSNSPPPPQQTGNRNTDLINWLSSAWKEKVNKFFVSLSLNLTFPFCYFADFI